MTSLVFVAVVICQASLIDAWSEPRPRYVLNEAPPRSSHDSSVIVEDANALNTSYWSNPSQITVCWETPGYAEKKLIVKNIIANTWSRHSSLRFHGWELCTSDPVDMRVKIADENPFSFIGMSGVKGRASATVLNFDFVNWGSTMPDWLGMNNIIEGYAIHEFGHAIGLLHEQGHPKAHKNCTSRYPASKFEDRAALTIYDPDSVMNYCNSNVAQNYLSPLDIEAVGIMYPPKTSFTTDRSTESTTQATTQAPIQDTSRPTQEITRSARTTTQNLFPTSTQGPTRTTYHVPSQTTTQTTIRTSTQHPTRTTTQRTIHCSTEKPTKHSTNNAPTTTTVLATESSRPTENDEAILIISALVPHIQAVILPDDKSGDIVVKQFPMLDEDGGWPRYVPNGDYSMNVVVADDKLFLFESQRSFSTAMKHHVMGVAKLPSFGEYDDQSDCGWQCRFESATPPTMNHNGGSFVVVRANDKEFILVCGGHSPAQARRCEFKPVGAYLTSDGRRDAWSRVRGTDRLERLCLQNHAGISHKGNLIVTGGNCGGRTVQSTHHLNFQTGRWTELPDMKLVRENHVMASDDRFVYACGDCVSGTPSVPTCEMYDGKRWSIMQSHSVHLCHFNLASYGKTGDLLVIGGWNGTQNKRDLEHYNGTHWRTLTGEQSLLNGNGGAQRDAVRVPASLIQHWQ